MEGELEEQIKKHYRIRKTKEKRLARNNYSCNDGYEV
jgi:hypothetical protein